jgi:hypothetical protein
MDYSIIHGSQNLIVAIYIEIVAVIILLTFLYLFIFKKKFTFELSIVGISTGTFAFYSVGPTVNPLFIFSLFLLFREIISFLNKKNLFKINNRILFLFIAPFILLVTVLINTIIDSEIKWNPNGKLLIFYKFIIFYVKDFACFVILLIVINRELKNNTRAENNRVFLRCLVFVSYFSAGISVLQILNAITINSQLVGEIFGVRYGVGGISQGSVSLSMVRPQALFIEPRNYGAFLAITLPFFNVNKNYRKN